MASIPAVILLAFITACGPGKTEHHDRRARSVSGNLEPGANETGGAGEAGTSGGLPSGEAPTPHQSGLDQKFLEFVSAVKSAQAAKVSTVMSQDLFAVSLEAAKLFGTANTGVAIEKGKCMAATGDPALADGLAAKEGIVIEKGTSLVMYVDALTRPEDCGKQFQAFLGDRFQENLIEIHTSYFSYSY